MQHGLAQATLVEQARALDAGSSPQCSGGVNHSPSMRRATLPRVNSVSSPRSFQSSVSNSAGVPGAKAS